MSKSRSLAMLQGMAFRASIWTIVLSTAHASFGVCASDDADDSAYVVLITESDSSVEALFDRYPELSGSWEDLAKFNLLRRGQAVEIPRGMLTTDGVLAKVASYYGEAEVKRSFDQRYIPLVPNLLLREGDELRTWRRSGVRILFDDGNYIVMKGHSRAQLASLGTKEAPLNRRVLLILKEGGIWSEMNKVEGKFEIRTPTASTLIRGTGFRIKVEPGDATRLEVLHGTVEFRVGDHLLSVDGKQGVLALDEETDPAAVPLPPAPERLTSPQPKQVIHGAGFDQTFEWSAVPAAEAYQLEIARDESFFDLVVERRISGPRARVTDLSPGTYFWRVSTLFANGFEGPSREGDYFVYVQRRP